MPVTGILKKAHKYKKSLHLYWSYVVDYIFFFTNF